MNSVVEEESTFSIKLDITSSSGQLEEVDTNAMRVASTSPTLDLWPPGKEILMKIEHKINEVDLFEERQREMRKIQEERDLEKVILESRIRELEAELEGAWQGVKALEEEVRKMKFELQDYECKLQDTETILQEKEDQLKKLE